MDDSKDIMVREWVAVAALLFVLFTLILHAAGLPNEINKTFSEHQKKISDHLIQVEVEGDVLHPGTYIFKRGITALEAIVEAKPSTDRQPEDERLNRVLKGGEKVRFKATSEKKIKKSNEKS